MWTAAASTMNSRKVAALRASSMISRDASLEDRREQVVLRREAAEDRRDADAGAFGHLRHAGLEAVLGEDGARGLENEAAVALGVGAQRRHAATGTISSASWICATSRWRTSSRSTPIAAAIQIAPMKNARW